MHRHRSESVPVMALIGAVLVGAYMLAVALGSRGYAGWGWLSLLPLFAAIRVLKPLHAMLLGGLWGAGVAYFARGVEVGVSASAIPAWLLLVTVPSLYTLFGARLTRRLGFSPLWLAIGWVGVELALRPLHLSGGLLAGVRDDGTTLGLLGGVVGYGAIAFTLAYLNASLVSLLEQVRIPSGGLLYTRRNGPVPQRFWWVHWAISRVWVLYSIQPRAPPQTFM